MMQNYVELSAEVIIWQNRQIDKILLNFLGLAKLSVKVVSTGKIKHLGFP